MDTSDISLSWSQIYNKLDHYYLPENSQLREEYNNSPLEWIKNISINVPESILPNQQSLKRKRRETNKYITKQMVSNYIQSRSSKNGFYSYDEKVKLMQ